MAYYVSPTQTFSQWAKDMEADYQFYEPKEPNSIVLNSTGNDEMIRITAEGFWVRGVKVPQDDREAETVYAAFKQWLAWANLQRK